MREGDVREGTEQYCPVWSKVGGNESGRKRQDGKGI